MRTLRRRMLFSKAWVALCGLALLIALVPLFAILYTLVAKGIHWWSVAFFTKTPQFPSILEPNDIGGISNAIIGSLVIDGLAAFFAIPIGIVAGLLLAESSSKFAGWLRTTAEIMTGLPSILLGIFAYQILVVGFDEWGIKLPGIGFAGLAGSFAIGVLMIPIIMKAAETSLRGVPVTIREAGLALGARQGVVARRVVIPTALPGLVTAVLIAFSRAVGETAPILWVIGASTVVSWNPQTPDGFPPAADLPVILLTVRIAARRVLGDRTAFRDRCARHKPEQPAPGGVAPEGEAVVVDGISIAPVSTGMAEPRADPRSGPVSMSFKDVAVSFNGRAAIRDVTFDVPMNRVTALIGPSGSGKTTLLRAINRLHDLTKGAVVTGTILLGHTDVYRGIPATLLRTRVGMVFQRPNPFPTMSIYDNVVSGLRFNGIRKKALLDEAAESALIAAALWDSVNKRMKAHASTLSGGEQQRLCIARALAVEPEVLLMDEPTSSLDPVSTRLIEELLGELKSRVTILIVTHNMQQAARVSDLCAFFLMGDDRAGEQIEVAPTRKMFSEPDDPRTLDYIHGRFG